MGSIAMQARAIRRLVEGLDSKRFAKTAFTVKEAAIELGCTQVRVRELLTRGELRTPGSLIPRRQIERLKRERLARSR